MSQASLRQIHRVAPFSVAVGIALLIASLGVTSARAQQAPQLTPRDLRPDTAPPMPAPLPKAAPAASSAPAEAAQLFVQPAEIIVVDGDPVLAGTTGQLTAAVRGRRVSVADLYNLADAVEALYRSAGYPLVRVTLPPQHINDGGSLRMVVLDGFIERIDVSALDVRARARVEALLRPLLGQRRLSDDALERALTLAGRAPGVAVRSTLQPGSAPGGVVLVMDGQYSLVNGAFGADNRLSKSLGPWESNAQVSLNQVLGLGEFFYLNAASGADLDTAYRGRARRRVAGVGMVVPVGASGLALNPEYTFSDSAPPPMLGAPATRSRFERSTIRLIYPLILTRQQELTLTGTLEAISQTDTLPDFHYTLDHDRLRVVRYGAAWNAFFSERSQLSASVTLSQGAAGLGARTPEQAVLSGPPLSRAQSRPDFLKLEANLALDLALPKGVQSHSVLRAQKTMRGVLPSAELFNIDGEDALSTFTAGTLADDSGATLRQELALPFSASLRGSPLTITPNLFGALGKGYSAYGAQASRGLGRAYGVGLRLRWYRTSLALEYGRRGLRGATLDDKQLFVKAQVQF